MNNPEADQSDTEVLSKCRLLFITPDGYPTFRQDVATLFGKYLPAAGISTHLVAQATAVGQDEPPP